MSYADREAQRAYQRDWMRRRREMFMDGKRCGFCNSADRLELHHLDPAIKEHHNIWSWSRARREAEIAKCIVLCRACHIKRHQEERPAFCKRGHPMTGANVYLSPKKNRRECRACRALRRAA